MAGGVGGPGGKIEGFGEYKYEVTDTGKLKITIHDDEGESIGSKTFVLKRGQEALSDTALMAKMVRTFNDTKIIEAMAGQMFERAAASNPLSQRVTLATAPIHVTFSADAVNVHKAASATPIGQLKGSDIIAFVERYVGFKRELETNCTAFDPSAIAPALEAVKRNHVFSDAAQKAAQNKELDAFLTAFDHVSSQNRAAAGAVPQASVTAISVTAITEAVLGIIGRLTPQPPSAGQLPPARRLSVPAATGGAAAETEPLPSAGRIAEAAAPPPPTPAAAVPPPIRPGELDTTARPRPMSEARSQRTRVSSEEIPPEDATAAATRQLPPISEEVPSAARAAAESVGEYSLSEDPSELVDAALAAQKAFPRATAGIVLQAVDEVRAEAPVPTAPSSQAKQPASSSLKEQIKAWWRATFGPGKAAAPAVAQQAKPADISKELAAEEIEFQESVAKFKNKVSDLNLSDLDKRLIKLEDQRKQVQGKAVAKSIKGRLQKLKLKNIDKLEKLVVSAMKKEAELEFKEELNSLKNFIKDATSLEELYQKRDQLVGKRLDIWSMKQGPLKELMQKNIDEREKLVVAAIKKDAVRLERIQAKIDSLIEHGIKAEKNGAELLKFNKSLSKLNLQEIGEIENYFAQFGKEFFYEHIKGSRELFEKFMLNKDALLNHIAQALKDAEANQQDELHYEYTSFISVDEAKRIEEAAAAQVGAVPMPPQAAEPYVYNPFAEVGVASPATPQAEIPVVQRPLASEDISRRFEQMKDQLAKPLNASQLRDLSAQLSNLQKEIPLSRTEVNKEELGKLRNKARNLAGMISRQRAELASKAPQKKEYPQGPLGEYQKLTDQYLETEREANEAGRALSEEQLVQFETSFSAMQAPLPEGELRTSIKTRISQIAAALYHIRHPVVKPLPVAEAVSVGPQPAPVIPVMASAGKEQVEPTFSHVAFLEELRKLGEAVDVLSTPLAHDSTAEQRIERVRLIDAMSSELRNKKSQIPTDKKILTRSQANNLKGAITKLQVKLKESRDTILPPARAPVPTTQAAPAAPAVAAEAKAAAPAPAAQAVQLDQYLNISKGDFDKLSEEFKNALFEELLAQIDENPENRELENLKGLFEIKPFAGSYQGEWSSPKRDRQYAKDFESVIKQGEVPISQPAKAFDPFAEDVVAPAQAPQPAEAAPLQEELSPERKIYSIIESKFAPVSKGRFSPLDLNEDEKRQLEASIREHVMRLGDDVLQGFQHYFAQAEIDQPFFGEQFELIKGIVDEKLRAPAQAFAEVQDAIVSKINNRTITQAELERLSEPQIRAVFLSAELHPLSQISVPAKYKQLFIDACVEKYQAFDKISQNVFRAMLQNPKSKIAYADEILIQLGEKPLAMRMAAVPAAAQAAKAKGAAAAPVQPRPLSKSEVRKTLLEEPVGVGSTMLTSAKLEVVKNQPQVVGDILREELAKKNGKNIVLILEAVFAHPDFAQPIIAAHPEVLQEIDRFLLHESPVSEKLQKALALKDDNARKAAIVNLSRETPRIFGSILDQPIDWLGNWVQLHTDRAIAFDMQRQAAAQAPQAAAEVEAPAGSAASIEAAARVATALQPKAKKVSPQEQAVQLCLAFLTTPRSSEQLAKEVGQGLTLAQKELILEEVPKMADAEKYSAILAAISEYRKNLVKELQKTDVSRLDFNQLEEKLGDVVGYKAWLALQAPIEQREIDAAETVRVKLVLALTELSRPKEVERERTPSAEKQQLKDAEQAIGALFAKLIAANESKNAVQFSDALNELDAFEKQFPENKQLSEIRKGLQEYCRNPAFMLPLPQESAFLKAVNEGDISSFIGEAGFKELLDAVLAKELVRATFSTKPHEVSGALARIEKVIEVVAHALPGESCLPRLNLLMARSMFSQKLVDELASAIKRYDEDNQGKKRVQLFLEILKKQDAINHLKQRGILFDNFSDLEKKIEGIKKSDDFMVPKSGHKIHLREALITDNKLNAFTQDKLPGWIRNALTAEMLRVEHAAASQKEEAMKALALMLINVARHHYEASVFDPDMRQQFTQFLAKQGVALLPSLPFGKELQELGTLPIEDFFNKENYDRFAKLRSENSLYLIVFDDFLQKMIKAKADEFVSAAEAAVQRKDNECLGRMVKAIANNQVLLGRLFELHEQFPDKIEYDELSKEAATRARAEAEAKEQQAQPVPAVEAEAASEAMDESIEPPSFQILPVPPDVKKLLDAKEYDRDLAVLRASKGEKERAIKSLEASIRQLKSIKGNTALTQRYAMQELVDDLRRPYPMCLKPDTEVQQKIRDMKQAEREKFREVLEEASKVLEDTHILGRIKTLLGFMDAKK